MQLYCDVYFQHTICYLLLLLSYQPPAIFYYYNIPVVFFMLLFIIIYITTLKIKNFLLFTFQANLEKYVT